MSFKPEVRAGSLEWTGNALRFTNKSEALAYVLDLAQRWTLVTESRVVKSSDPANYKWQDGRAIPLNVNE